MQKKYEFSVDFEWKAEFNLFFNKKLTCFLKVFYYIF